jgi:anti-sigma regulatory factor (Ser/Thr protein kinase)
MLSISAANIDNNALEGCQLVRVRVRGEGIRRFILENVEKHPGDIAKMTSEQFGVTRQAVSSHIRKLISEKVLCESGNTRSRTYQLCPMAEWHGHYDINPSLEEDVVWRNDILPALGPAPDNTKAIWHYGFTEIFNNAIDHSGSPDADVFITKNAVGCQMRIWDHGIGIFRKIQSELNLLDERHAILELSKGKLTTDPRKHTGEGIFFASRMFDEFVIASGGVCFSHVFTEKEDWNLDQYKNDGTLVLMSLNNHTSRTTKKIFDQYSSGEDYSFNKTVVPVKLAQYGDENLISRSQAKRLLARVELFKTVMLDFEMVPSIGQAFADEIFRVFAKAHPEIELIPYKANPQIKRMIERARSNPMGQEETTA